MRLDILCLEPTTFIAAGVLCCDNSENMRRRSLAMEIKSSDYVVLHG